jgi:hypothetical protein
MNSKTRTVALVVVSLLLVVALLVGAGWAAQRAWYEQSYGSEYAYEVRVGPNYHGDTITNVTVLVPLPAHGGSQSVADAVASQDLRFPDGWSYAVVDTEYGPMLRFEADEIPGEPTYFRAVMEGDRLVDWEEIPAAEYSRNDSETIRVDHDDIEVRTTVEADETIDTRSPTGTEPLLSPRSNQRQVDCEAFYERDDVTCYAYDSRVFLAYDAEPGTEVFLDVELRGTNSWWVLGWNYNEYRDGVRLLTDESPDGWTTVDGQLVTGSGNYR